MIKIYLKAFLILFTFVVNVPALNAQRELNYIYLFDCTKSMKGFAGAKDIWEPTKQYLNESISMLPHDATVNIIPFGNNPSKPLQFLAKDFNWDSVESVFDKQINFHTATNICAAWDEGIKLIDEHKENYFFILTDGIDNVEGTAALSNRIRDWCQKFKFSHAFYLMLTEAAENDEILDAINESCSITVIGPTFNPKPIVRLSYNSIMINSDELNKINDIRIPIIGRYNAKIINGDQNYNVNLIDDFFDNGKASYQILNYGSNASQSEHYKFKFQIVSDELKIANPEVEVTIINIPERILNLAIESEINIGRARFYPSFLFVPKKEQNLLEVDLSPIFNSHAITARSSLKFVVSGHGGKKDYDVYYNGEPVISDVIEITSDNSTAALGIKFHDNAKEGKRYFNVKASSFYNLNRINNVSPEEFEFSIRARYQAGMNPLLKVIIGLAILILITIVLLSIIFRISNGKIKYNLSIEKPVYKALLRRNEARKLVLTSNKRLNQTTFNRMLKGKTKYVYDDFWHDDFVLTAATRGVRISKSRIYDCEPFGGILKPNDNNNGQFSLIHTETKKTIILKIR